MGESLIHQVTDFLSQRTLINHIRELSEQPYLGTIIGGHEGLVVANNSNAAIKQAVLEAKGLLGESIQVCDGVDDDVTFDNCMKTLTAKRGDMKALKGVYYFGNTWNNSAGGETGNGNGWNGVVLSGQGRTTAHLGTEIKYNGSATGYMITHKRVSPNMTYFSGIKNLSLDCEGLAGGIEVYRANYADFDNLYIDDVKVAGHAFYINNCIIGNFSNMHLSGAGQANNPTGAGFYVDANNYGNQYRSIYSNGFYYGYLGYLSQGCQYNSCAAESCDYGYYINKSVGGTIFNPYCEGNVNADIYLNMSSASTSITIIGGQLSGSATYGIVIPASADIDTVILIGVYTENHGTAGLYIEGGNTDLKSVIAIGCTFSDGISDADGKLTTLDNWSNNDGRSFTKKVRGTYDFSVDGGTQGTIGLKAMIPNDAIVTRAYYQVLTTCTSAGDNATIALGIPTDDAAGLLAAIAIGDGTDPWDAGHHECIQDGTAANFSEQTTAERELSMTIAVENLTAGKFILWAEYVVSD